MEGFDLLFDWTWEWLWCLHFEWSCEWFLCEWEWWLCLWESWLWLWEWELWLWEWELWLWEWELWLWEWDLWLWELCLCEWELWLWELCFWHLEWSWCLWEWEWCLCEWFLCEWEHLFNFSCWIFDNPEQGLPLFFPFELPCFFIPWNKYRETKFTRKDRIDIWIKYCVPICGGSCNLLIASFFNFQSPKNFPRYKTLPLRISKHIKYSRKHCTKPKNSSAIVNPAVGFFLMM